MIGYLNGEYLSQEGIKISPNDRGFLLGDGVYEVIRAYRGKLFRQSDHLSRLQRSLQGLEIANVDILQISQVVGELLGRNNLENRDATIYIQVTRGSAPRRHAFPDSSTPPTIYLTAAPFSPPTIKSETGVKVILVPDIRWARCDIKSIALTANVMANQRAVECDAEEAIFVREGVITEGSHSNFGAVFGGEFVAHPKTNQILAGITREVTLGLCSELGIPVKEFPIFERDLSQADEAVIISTSNEVMSVVQVGDRRVGSGKPGPIARKLQSAFRELT